MVKKSIKKNKKKIVKFLSEFISHPSEAPKTGDSNVSECMYWLKNKLEGWGWEPYIELLEKEKGEINLAIRLPGKSGKKALMFNGHADVVPVRRASLWNFDPYEGKIQDNKVWGRGSSDMKGGVTSFLWAAKLIRERSIKPQHDLILTVNVGEESARQKIGVETCLENGYNAPLVINAEPNQLNLARASVGWFFFKVIVKGKSTHPANKHICLDSSIPSEEKPGIDSISKLRKIMNGMNKLDQKWNKNQTELFPPGTMNMTCVYVNGGQEVARIADYAEAMYAVIYHPNYRREDILNQLKEIINQTVEEDEWLKNQPPEFKVPIIDPYFEPFIVEKNDKFLKKVSNIMKSHSGVKANITYFRSPSDANMIAETGSKVLIIGPGSLDYGCHGIDEYIPIDQLINAVELYTKIIEEFIY